jgi:glutathione S-transferase
MLLYDSAVSGNCYKVRLLLAQLGLEYERREVDVIDRADRQELLRAGAGAPVAVLRPVQP